MSELKPNPQPPSELLQDSAEWSQDRFLAERKGNATEVLKGHYVHSLQLFEANRQRILQKIEEAGGLARYPGGGILKADYTNGVLCKDGSVVTARDMLCMDPIDLAIDDSPGTVGTEQSYQLHLAFGGGGIGIGASSATEVNDLRFTFDHNGMEDIIEGKYVPTSICITEAVISAYGKEKEASGLLYGVTCRPWGAKLREEFAPDPAKKPEAYATWVNQEPIPQLDLTFGASPKPARNRYYWGHVDFGNAPSMKTYISETRYQPLDVEGAEKIIRFEQLLKFLWEHEFGYPMPSTFIPGIEENDHSRELTKLTPAIEAAI